MNLCFIIICNILALPEVIQSIFKRVSGVTRDNVIWQSVPRVNSSISKTISVVNRDICGSINSSTKAVSPTSYSCVLCRIVAVYVSTHVDQRGSQDVHLQQVSGSCLLSDASFAW